MKTTTTQSTITFVVHGPPIPAPRMTRGGIFAKNHKNRKYIDAYLNHKQYVGWCAKEAGSPYFEGPVEMNVIFYVADKRKRDTKNMLSTAEDGLNNVVIHDDSQFVRTTMEKRLDRENPRTEITLIQLDPDDWDVY